MKKKVIAVLMSVCMSMGLVACGEKSISLVTINGKEYNLTEDFQDVVGEMVEDDIMVADMKRGCLYDDDGRFSSDSIIKSDIDDYSGCCYVNESPCVAQYPDIPIVCAVYYVGREETDYQTADGITYDSDEDDLEELNGYISVKGMADENKNAYAAIYVEGKKVDLKEYEDEMEDFLEMAEEDSFADAMKEYSINSYDACAWISYRLNPAMMSEDDSFEGELLLALAAQEAGDDLEDEDIEFYDIVVYDCNDDGIELYYYHYYNDDDWDSKKFKRN